MGLRERVRRIKGNLLQLWRPEAEEGADRMRICRFQQMEPRMVLSANSPEILLGAVYTEQTSTGAELSGDKFEIHWTGGAQGTQLTQLVITGDQDGNGFDDGDVFFDADGNAPGVGGFFGFTVTGSAGIDSVSHSLSADGLTLTLNVVGWDPGEKLTFTIDVDEQDDTPNSLVEGAEFQNSKLQATFVDTTGHHQNTVGNGTFFDSYDNLIPAGINVPLDQNVNPGEGTDVRTAGAGFTVNQQAKPFTISGQVYEDKNLNNVMEGGESGISGVGIKLQMWDAGNNQWIDTGLDTTTDANGLFSFTHDCPGEYRIVETQPSPYFSVGASVQSNGTVTTPDIISNIVVKGGENLTNYKFGEALPVSISGHVYHDVNDNGTRDGGEQGIGNTQVTLNYTPPGGGAQTFSTTTLNTGDVGFYSFTNLNPLGTYSLVETQPGGWIDGKDAAGSIGGTVQAPDLIHSISFTQSGQSAVNYDFGELLAASISGKVFADPNDNVVQDAGEQGIPQTTVWLLNSNGQRLTSTTTAGDGTYSFTGLTPGAVYGIEEVQPSNFFDGHEKAGNASTPGSVTSNDKITGIVLVSGQNATGYDFGELPPASLSGSVYVDINDNGVRDSGEIGIGGVTVELLKNGTPTGITTQTAGNGSYTFTGLEPGQYGVREFQPSNYFDGKDRAGSEGGAAQNPGDQITGVILASGTVAVNYDFGELPPAMISGIVFQDGPPVSISENTDVSTINLTSLRNGVLTPDDTRLPGVLLILADADGNPLTDGGGNLITATTDASGFYQFTGLRAGTYTVIQVHPAGYFDGIDTPGTKGGVAANPGVVHPTLAKFNHQGDAITLITVGYGETAALNNFSEIVVDRFPPPPPPPPPLPPVVDITNPVQQVFQSNPPPPGGQPLAPTINPSPLAAQNRTAIFGGGGALPGSDNSWHLSIIDAGTPRGNSLDGEQFVSVANVSMLALFNEAKGELNQSRWVLQPSDGSPVQVVIFGMSYGRPVTGDFNGDGVSEVGVFHEGRWYLDLNGNGVWDDADLWLDLGGRRDIPVTGDWDADGKADIGIYGPEWPNDHVAVMYEPGLPDAENRPADIAKNVPPKAKEATQGKRQLILTSRGNMREDVIDHVFQYGAEGDVPLIGDWNGDGVETIGIFNRGMWILDDNGDGKWLPGETVVEMGRAGDLPVVGDFDGDGVDDLGIFHAGQWHVDANGDRVLDAHDKVFELGGPGDLPVVGDWDGDGLEDPGVYQPGQAHRGGAGEL